MEQMPTPGKIPGEKKQDEAHGGVLGRLGNSPLRNLTFAAIAALGLAGKPAEAGADPRMAQAPSSERQAAEINKTEALAEELEKRNLERHMFSTSPEFAQWLQAVGLERRVWNSVSAWDIANVFANKTLHETPAFEGYMKSISKLPKDEREWREKAFQKDRQLLDKLRPVVLSLREKAGEPKQGEDVLGYVRRALAGR